MEPQHILIKGARQHNLKNIDVQIPRNQLVVITGISGSGKSSLAFDTIYAEGQRRYVESISSYARQFLQQMGKPDVDTIEGLSPAISIEQKTTSRNPRSTVGTVTEIYDYLRLLFARVGKATCYQCGREIVAQTLSQMVDRVLKLPEGTRIHLLAPIVRGRKGEHHKELAEFQKKGFVRVRIDGQVYNLESLPTLDKNKHHNIDIVVDRLVIKPDIKTRLADSLETALNFSEGLAKIEILDGKENTEILFSEKAACIECGISYLEIAPRMFSFNSPHGACETCDGIGSKMFIDPELVIGNPNLSLREGAIIPWSGRHSLYYHSIMEALAKHYKFDLYTPFKDLSEKLQKIILWGSHGEKIRFYYERGEGRDFYMASFEGVIPILERRFKTTDSDSVREDIERFMNTQPCRTCMGGRLNRQALAIKVGEQNIYQWTQWPITTCLEEFQKLKLGRKDSKIAERILKEITDRLRFLVNVGVGYLSLDRTAGTLSGGEAQRIRLATQIGSSLVGVLYILDEPSIGLHQRDNQRLIDTLKRLRDIGNTVLVVEHDEDAIRSSDYVIDMGPGAGIQGGYVVAAGTPQQVSAHPKSLTGQFLSGKKMIPLPKQRRPGNGKFLELLGCTQNNLKNINLKIPLGTFTCITGVSGSGKSTLISETLYKALMQYLFSSKDIPGKHSKVNGLEYIDKVINIDQSPIGRTPRSNPATYTGLFAPIRDLFAMSQEAKVRGYKPGRFSFNVKGGRCEACEGDGLLRIEMHFLPDVYVECDECHGTRYNRETLEVKYKNYSIADILAMDIKKAIEVLASIPTVRKILQTLLDVGLGYIELGQSATTLSGGEAQRIKLSKELAKRATGRTLYILDEPTTGLHFADIHNLIEVLQRLVDQGNTVVVIEHNLDVIKTADHLIDLGPEGGDLGGYVVAEGTPEAISKNRKSYTGQYLARLLLEKEKRSVA